MNTSIIKNTLGNILRMYALLMLLPALVALIYGEKVIGFLIPFALTLLLSFLLANKKTAEGRLFAREGLVIVALAWILISAIGALPFVISGSIPTT